MNTTPNPDAVAPTLEEMAEATYADVIAHPNVEVAADHRDHGGVIHVTLKPGFTFSDVSTGHFLTPEDAFREVALARSPAVAPGVPAGVVRDYLAAQDAWDRFEPTVADDEGSWDNAIAEERHANRLRVAVETTRLALDAALSPDAQAAAGQAPTPAVGVEPSSTGEVR